MNLSSLTQAPSEWAEWAAHGETRNVQEDKGPPALWEHRSEWAASAQCLSLGTVTQDVTFLWLFRKEKMRSKREGMDVKA